MVEYQRRVIHGTYQRYNSSGLSGDYPPIQVCASGELVICSGLHVVADVEIIASSGLQVQISGQHVFVESGVHVLISGQGVVVNSGLHIITGVSGSPSQTMIQDLSGNVVAVSKRHEGLIVTTDTTRETHKGEMHHVSYCESGTAADTNLDMLIHVVSGKEVHSKFKAGAGAGFMAWLFENTATSDSGTPITAHNMNRVISGQAETLFSIGPTITSTHTPLFCEIGGSAVFKGGFPGSIRADTEWILNGVSGSIDYLFRVCNLDAAAKDTHLSMEFTEEEPVFW